MENVFGAIGIMIVAAVVFYVAATLIEHIRKNWWR